MTRTYDKQLECGCLISTDKNNPGMVPCNAEYLDMTLEENRKRLELHNKCMRKHFGK